MTPIPLPTRVTVPLADAQRRGIAELQQAHELTQARLTYYVSAITHGAGYGNATLVGIDAGGMVIEVETPADGG